MSIEDADQHTRTWREELPRLFGIKWDSFALWLIFGWASLWLWTSWISSNDLMFPPDGPISWIGGMLSSLAIVPPNWLLAVPKWLADPARLWLLPVCIVMSAVFATLSVRGDYKGLRFLALLALLFALEIDHSGWPLLWAGLIALVPALVALVWGIVDNTRDGAAASRSSYFYPWRVAREFINVSVGIYAFPVVAPLVLVIALITSYRTDIPFKIHEQLAATALQELDAQNQARSGPDQLTRFSLLAAIIAAPPSSRGRIAGDFYYRLKRQSEDRLLSQKTEIQLRWWNGFSE